MVDPHLGQGSIWTGALSLAQFFRHWLTENFGGEHVIYVAEVDLVPQLDVPFEAGSVDSSRVDAAKFAELGYRWLSFYEPAYGDNRLLAQYVYLGTDPIDATRMLGSAASVVG
jgi:hypothetical protein